MSSNDTKTWGCCTNEGLEDGHFVECVNCKQCYHLACLSTPGFEQDSVIPTDWNCPACIARAPKNGRNDSTPVRNVNTTRGNKRQALNSPPAPAPPVTSNDVRNIVQDLLKQELSSAVKEINSMIINIINNQLEPVKQEMRDMQDSMNFMSTKFDEIEVELSDTKRITTEIQAENVNLKCVVNELTHKINQLEQQSRANNLEIQCVPENKKENLYSIMNNLMQAVGCDLNENSIMHCTRTAKLNTETTRPRSIVVQLASPRARDHLLAAVIKFNKANPQNKLNSAHLGFSEIKSPVYVVEHLSPANKKLHAAARHASKDKHYKHVWTRYGKVFVRKTDDSDIVHITSVDSLKRLV